MNAWVWVALVAAAVVVQQAAYWIWFVWGPSRVARRVRLTHGGQRRSYLLHVPKGLHGPAPLVLVLHGAYDWAKRLADATHWHTLADEQGFIVAFPEATSPRLPRVASAWNAGHFGLHALRHEIDDVAFLLAVRDHIAQEHALSRLYLAGFSNGGMLAYHAAMLHPEEVAGVAAVGSAVWSGRDPESARPPELSMPDIPVVHIHGTQDRIVPYEGGPGHTLPGWSWCSTEETLAALASALGATAQEETDESETVRSRHYLRRDATCPLVFYRHAAGHSWPASKRPLFLERPDPSLDAERAIWTHWTGADARRRDKG